MRNNDKGDGNGNMNTGAMPATMQPYNTMQQASH